jgi:hypothetical protein
MLLYRPHRGLLEDSMAEVVEIVDFAHLVRHMRREVERWYPTDKLPTEDNTRVEPYGFDHRIGWDTHLVTVNGNAWGYTNGSCERAPRPGGGEMSERHLAMQLQHAAGFLRGMAMRLETLSDRALQASVPEFKKAARDCRTAAEKLQVALHAEGYDRVS